MYNRSQAGRVPPSLSTDCSCPSRSAACSELFLCIERTRPHRWYARCSCHQDPMNAEALFERSPSVGDAEIVLTLGAGAFLLLVGASRRSPVGACLAILVSASAVSRHHRPVAKHLQWSRGIEHASSAWRRARHPRSGIDPRGTTGRRRLPVLASPRKSPAVHVPPQPGRGGLRQEIALGCFRTREAGGRVGRRDHQRDREPGVGVAVAARLGHRHRRVGELPRSARRPQHPDQCVSAYAPPAGKAGALVASLFGREPSQTVREDLRHFKQRLEAGEVPRARASV